MLKIFGLLLLLSLNTCAPGKGKKDVEKETSETAVEETIAEKTIKKNMIEEGFSKGTIISNKSSDSGECSTILSIEGSTDKLDPINIEEFYKSDIPKLVWVKYASLRMKNRCKGGRPVSIKGIEKREE